METHLHSARVDGVPEKLPPKLCKTFVGFAGLQVRASVTHRVDMLTSLPPSARFSRPKSSSKSQPVPAASSGLDLDALLKGPAKQ